MLSAPIERHIMDILERSRGEETPWPRVPEELVAHLERLFPPRCLLHNEKVEDHLRYAGVADLVLDLRWHYERQQAPSEDELEVELGGVEDDE